MTVSLAPRRLLSFPSLSLPDFWEDDEDFSTSPASLSGLSVYEDDKKVYVDASIPGIDPKNVDVTYHDGYLWVRGEATEEEENKSKKFYKRAARSFSYRVALPGDVDGNSEPEATYKHGVMTVSFAKSPKLQPKKIQVKEVAQ